MPFLDLNEGEQSEDQEDYSTVAGFLAEFIFMAMDNGKVDNGKFAAFFNQNEMFTGNDKLATVDNPTVQNALKKANGGMSKEDLATFIVEEMKKPVDEKDDLPF